MSTAPTTRTPYDENGWNVDAFRELSNEELTKALKLLEGMIGS